MTLSGLSLRLKLKLNNQKFVVRDSKAHKEYKHKIESNTISLKPNCSPCSPIASIASIICEEVEEVVAIKAIEESVENMKRTVKIILPKLPKVA